MKPVEQELARYLLRQSDQRTKADVLERYAISYNTLRKIEKGLPLRVSLTQRLEDRLRRELTLEHEERQAHARKG